jgi:hypothetical protein
MNRRNKFNARKVKIDGQTFDSKLEAACWSLARDAAESGDWLAAIRQEKFQLLPQQSTAKGFEQPAFYTSDLALYPRNLGKLMVVVDVKSEITRNDPAYILRRKMMLYFHKIEIVEISSVAEMQDLLEKLKHA